MRRFEAALLCAALVGFASFGGCARNSAPTEDTAGSADAAAESSAERSPRFDPERTITPEELAELQRAVEENPYDPVAHQQLGRGLRDARRNEEALVHFERALQLEPGSPRRMLDLALAYSAVAQLDKAAAIYDDLSIVPSMTALASHNKGNILLRQGDAAGAIELYRKALEAKPDYLLAWYHLGVALEQNGELREAYRTYGRVVEFPTPEDDPAVLGAYIDALYRLGKLDVQMGATERGAEILAELIAAYPEHPNAHYQYAQALLKLGRQEEAERELALHMELLSKAQPSSPVATGD